MVVPSGGNSVIRVHRRQHPIGQGFFHSGTLAVGSAKFRYVYDCGSEDVTTLRSRIEVYCADNPTRVDALFVSHLDRDHVNGLDRLLTLVRAETVVLPYITDADLLVALADAEDRGEADSGLILFLSDVVGWFGDRGVSRVIFVRGNDTEPPEGAPPELPPAPPPPAAGADTIGFDLDAAVAVAGTVTRQTPVLGADVEVLTIDHRTPLLLRAGSQLLNWAFLTFVHPEVVGIAAFRGKIREAFPTLPGLDPPARPDYGNVYAALSAILKSPESRGKLAECYAHIRKNRNLTSMALYSGPLGVYPRYSASCRSTDGTRRLAVQQTERCGSIATGDANLRAAGRRLAFLRHYDTVLKYVWSVALPHHGSRHNFSGQMLDSRHPVYVAAAGQSNRYGHPHPEVVLEIRGRDADIFVTTEDPRTALDEVAELSSGGAEIGVPVDIYLIGVLPNHVFTCPMRMWANSPVSEVAASLTKLAADRGAGERLPSVDLVLRWDTLERQSGDLCLGQVSAPRALLVTSEGREPEAATIRQLLMRGAEGDRLAEWLVRHGTDPRQSMSHD
jgi:Metallo-beta-lactamase superfamily